MLGCAELIPVQPSETVSQTFSNFEFENADYWQNENQLLLSAWVAFCFFEAKLEQPEDYQSNAISVLKSLN